MSNPDVQDAAEARAEVKTAAHQVAGDHRRPATAADGGAGHRRGGQQVLRGVLQPHRQEAGIRGRRAGAAHAPAPSRRQRHQSDRR